MKTYPISQFISASHKIKLTRVSDDNTTFLEWETFYSNDINSEIYQE